MSVATMKPAATGLRRFKPYPSYTDSGVEWLGEIPAHWEVYALRRKLFRESGSIKIGPFGSALKLEFMTHEGFKVYGQEHVIARDFSRGSKYVDQAKFTELAACEIRPGDIVVTMMGSSGRSAVVPDDIERGIMDSHLLRIRLPNAELDPRFLALLIDEADYVRDQIGAAGKGAIMQGLNSSIIKSVLLAAPPTTEQVRILAFLDRETARIDVLVAKKERLIELLQDKRTALITRAVTKGLDPNVPMNDSGVKWLGDIPRHWNVCALRHVIRGGTRNGLYKSPEYYQPDGTPMIQMGEAFASPVVASCASDRLKLTTAESSIWALDEGDLLFARRSLVFEGSGKCSIVGELPEPHVFESSLIRVRPDKKQIVPNFLFLFLQSSVSRAQILAMTKKVTISGIDSQQLKAVCVVVPPKHEQRAIVDFIRVKDAEFQKLIDKVHQAIDRLKELRAALISAAVMGKIDVRDEVK